MGYFEPNATVLAITGRHAERYLQARLTNDVRLASETASLLAAALTPQGKTEAFGRIIKTIGGVFYFVVEGGDPSAIIGAIARFKVAEQVDIKAVDSLGVLHLYGAEAESLLSSQWGSALPCHDKGAALIAHETPMRALLRCQRVTVRGIDVIAPADELTQLQSLLKKEGVSQLSSDEREALRLEAHLPAFPHEVNDTVILSEAGLIEAVSFTKGCYTGQEVIAKIDALGKAPRRLISLSIQGKHLIESATPLTAHGKTIGKVTSAAFHPKLDRTLVFALIKNDGAAYPEGITAGELSLSVEIVETPRG
ncbi:MAG: folate-binding protein YgfZ [Pseudomonadota bacterium]|jgi:folate-binding protein YgfZ